MPHLIRPAQDADLEPLRSIFNQIVAAGDAFVYERAFAADEFRRYLDGYTATWVAEWEGRLVGGYVLRANQPGRGAHVANATYFVDPHVRGQGIGRQLGEHSLEMARHMGFRAMQFNAVVAGNQPAVKLWQDLGFTVIGNVPAAFRLPDGTHSDLLVMHREL